MTERHGGEFDAVHAPRHAHVGNDEIVFAALQCRERVVGRRAARYDMPELGEHVLGDCANEDIVLHDEHAERA